MARHSPSQPTSALVAFVMGRIPLLGRIDGLQRAPWAHPRPQRRGSDWRRSCRRGRHADIPMHPEVVLGGVHRTDDGRGRRSNAEPLVGHEGGPHDATISLRSGSGSGSWSLNGWPITGSLHRRHILSQSHRGSPHQRHQASETAGSLSSLFPCQPYSAFVPTSRKAVMLQQSLVPCAIPARLLRDCCAIASSGKRGRVARFNLAL